MIEAKQTGDNKIQLNITYTKYRGEYAMYGPSQLTIDTVNGRVDGITIAEFDLDGSPIYSDRWWN